MKDTILAYTAGLIDADGYIGIIRKKVDYKGQEKIYYSPCVKLTSVNRVTTDYLKKHFGGYVYHRKSSHENHSDSWSWEIKNNRPTAIFLKKIVSYLCMKKPQARLVLKYYELASYANARSVSPKIRAIERYKREKIYWELKSLHY